MNDLNDLVKIVENLKKSPIKDIIDKRMNEFEELGKENSNEIFKELCFCFLTANFSAERGMDIQDKINNGFLHLTEEDLAKKLSEFGHRFPNARAKFIFEARKQKDELKEIFESLKDEAQIRDWIVNNIKGVGYKESSHFLRNIGFKNISIIDFHIVDLLVRNNLIERPKTINPKKYLEVEKILKQLTQETNTNLGELDLYLWYSETGKILK